MENKKLGIILIIIGIVLVAAIYIAKSKEDVLVEKIIAEEGSCFLEDGLIQSS